MKHTIISHYVLMPCLLPSLAPSYNIYEPHFMKRRKKEIIFKAYHISVVLNTHKQRYIARERESHRHIKCHPNIHTMITPFYVRFILSYLNNYSWHMRVVTYLLTVCPWMSGYFFRLSLFCFISNAHRYKNSVTLICIRMPFITATPDKCIISHSLNANMISCHRVTVQM